MALGPEYFEPVDGERAFARPELSSRSRAAQLLLIVEQLSRPPDSPAPTATDVDAAVLRVPALGRASQALDSDPRRGLIDPDRGRGYSSERASKLWLEAQRDSDPRAAIELLGLSVDDPSPFVRLSAIVGLLALARPDEPSPGTDGYLLYRLFEEQYGEPNATRGLASDLFSMISGGETRDISKLDVYPPSPDAPAPLSIGVHGTFSRYGESRVAPQHRFYRYLGQKFSPDLFKDESRYFRWSGRYSRYDRLKGARDLPLWLHSIGKATQLDTVYAHSHGGNVALSAAAAGVRINFLVLLSVPPIVRSAAEWAAIRGNVGYMMSLRSHADRIILLDLVAGRVPAIQAALASEPSAGLDFPPQADIYTASPFGWFSHSSWLDKRVWQSKGIEAEVRNKYKLTHP